MAEKAKEKAGGKMAERTVEKTSEKKGSRQLLRAIENPPEEFTPCSVLVLQ